MCVDTVGSNRREEGGGRREEGGGRRGGGRREEAVPVAADGWRHKARTKLQRENRWFLKNTQRTRREHGLLKSIAEACAASCPVKVLVLNANLNKLVHDITGSGIEGFNISIVGGRDFTILPLFSQSAALATIALDKVPDIDKKCRTLHCHDDDQHETHHSFCGLVGHVFQLRDQDLQQILCHCCEGSGGGREL